MIKPSSAHTILARHLWKTDKNGKPLTRYFTPTGWAVLPSVFHGKKPIPKSGWVQTSENIPQEAKEAMETKEIKKAPKADKPVLVDKPIEAMSGKELLDYAVKNDLTIENPESLTKSQLLEKVSACLSQ